MDPTLYRWAREAAEALELPAELGWTADRETVGTVLDLAREVAGGVARPAAPVGTFLAGVAVGLARAGDPGALELLRERLRATLGEAPGDEAP